MICLHEPFLDDQVSRDVLLRAARSIVAVAKYISDADYDYLDPLIGVCTLRQVPGCFTSD